MDVPRGARWTTGCWWPWVQPTWPLAGAPAVQRRGAAMLCPTCGRGFCLVNHQVAADGAVSPSVVCPYTGCTFHVFLRLLDWSP